MAKDNLLKLQGIVIEARPAGMFEVLIEENQHKIMATVSGKIRTNNIRILVGDTVDVEVSVYDLSRGRITYRYK